MLLSSYPRVRVGYGGLVFLGCQSRGTGDLGGGKIQPSRHGRSGIGTEFVVFWAVILFISFGCDWDVAVAWGKGVFCEVQMEEGALRTLAAPIRLKWQRNRNNPIQNLFIFHHNVCEYLKNSFVQSIEQKVQIMNYSEQKSSAFRAV